MFGLTWTEIGLLVLFLGVIPAVGIAFFGTMTALLWRAVKRNEARRLDR